MATAVVIRLPAMNEIRLASPRSQAALTRAREVGFAVRGSLHRARTRAPVHLEIYKEQWKRSSDLHKAAGDGDVAVLREGRVRMISIFVSLRRVKRLSTLPALLDLSLA